MCEKLAVVILIVVCCAWQTEAAINCTSAGRFPDPDDTTCQIYYLCVLDTTNNYTSYNYTCPDTSLFNPTSQICTTNYTCTTNTTNTNDTTTTSPCTGDGYVADPNSTDCSSYIECVDINGTYSETTLTCPNGTYYNPNTTLCESDYVCASNNTTTTCTSPGRIADASDTTCQSYILCVELSDGTLEQYSYTCPSSSVFDPTNAVCTTNYTCPTAN